MELSGLPELQARLGHAHDGLLDLSETNAAAVHTVAGVADRITPRTSGRLVAGNVYRATAHGFTATNDTTYAVPRAALAPGPWLLVAARQTEETWTATLADHVQDLLDGK